MTELPRRVKARPLNPKPKLRQNYTASARLSWRQSPSSDCADVRLVGKNSPCLICTELNFAQIHLAPHFSLTLQMASSSSQPAPITWSGSMRRARMASQRIWMTVRRIILLSLLRWDLDVKQWVERLLTGTSE